MLVEWRGRTAFAERHLPQDVLYFARLFGEAVVSAVRTEDEAHCEIGGDDVTVLFGLERRFRARVSECARGRRAVGASARGIREIGTSGSSATPRGSRSSSHAGHAAVGDIGFQDAHRLVAVGPATDTANRLRARAARARRQVHRVEHGDRRRGGKDRVRTAHSASSSPRPARRPSPIRRRRSRALRAGSSLTAV